MKKFLNVFFLVITSVAVMASGGKTSNFSATNTSFTVVRAVTNCYQITIFENSANPTHDFLVAVPTATDVSTYHVSGERFVFVAPKTGSFSAGQAVGYIETVTAGPVEFAQEEF